MRVRTGWTGLFCVVALLAVLLGGTAPVLAEEADKANQAVEKRLEMTIPKVDFDEVKFENVIQFFRDVSGLNILVKWNELERAGIGRTTFVTLRLTKVSGRRTLRAILDIAGGANQLDWIIEEGIIVISTRNDLARRTLTRIYSAADLLCATRRPFTYSNGVPWYKTTFIPTAERITASDNNASSGGLFGESRFGEDNLIPGEEANALTTLLMDTVAPNSWRPTGEVGSIKVRGTDLVIVQNHANHKAVETLLEQLRQVRSGLELQIGLAVVRSAKADTLKRVKETTAKGGDVAAALESAGEDGLWSLDRCKVEEAALGDVLRATQVYIRNVETGKVDQDSAIVLNHTTQAGYEIGVLPKLRKDDGVAISVAYGCGWMDEKATPEKDTPEANTGIHRKHNTFDFTLKAGGYKTFTVIPPDAKNGGVILVVWLPEKK